MDRRQFLVAAAAGSAAAVVVPIRASGQTPTAAAAALPDRNTRWTAIQVKIHTPMSPEYSAGIIAFEVDGYTPQQVVQRLHDQQIVACVVRGFYDPLLARVAPSLLTTEEDVERTVRAIAAL